MLIFAIPAIILFYVFISKYKKVVSFFSPSLIIVLLYLLSSILAIPYICIYEQQKYFGVDSISYIFIFLILLFLFLSPFFSFKEYKIQKIVLPSLPILNIVSIIIVLLSIYAIIYFLPSVIRVFSLENLGDARVTMVEGDLFVTNSIFNTIASVSASMYPFAIILFFIYRSLGRNNNLSILLLLGSFSYVFHILAYVGRDGFVFWTLTFVATFGLFYNFLPKKEIIFLRKILVRSFCAILPFFIIISRDRFSGDVFNSFISYAGQSIPNFCLALKANYPVSGGAAFPLFCQILDLPLVESDVGAFGDTVTWVFGTFLKSLVLNVDIVGTILIGLFMGLLFLLVFRRRKTQIRFYQMFIYFLYFQIFSQGVFYFRQGNRGGNLYILLSLVLYFFFMLLHYTDSKRCVIHRRS